jgi:hypothetical protein
LITVESSQTDQADPAARNAADQVSIIAGESGMKRG